MSTPSNPAITPPDSALPIQFSPFKEEHFKSAAGLAFFNLQWQQMVNALNAGNGAAGRVTLPHGVDVKGATVTGLGDPQEDTDAVSQAHVSTTYGYGAQRAQLDIGGKHALKGLTWAVGKINQIQQQAGNIPSTYTGGGVINIGGALIQFGFVASMGGGATNTVVVTFPQPFPNACQAVLPCTTGPNDRITYVSVLPTLTDVSISNNGSGAGAFWVALGW